MKNFYYFLLNGLVGFSLQAQDPSIVWQKTMGGNSTDLVYSLLKTADNGLVIGGYSDSNASGEKSEDSRGFMDVWIVKTDASGAILWDKTYGGNGDDFFTSISETSDGGFIVGVGSNSTISGDKTENSRGSLDYWILKLDASGNLEWQKTYGGAQAEFDANVFQTSDGGYFVSGYSDSNVSGDKTDPTKGQRDYWVLKLNSSGGIVWQKSLGGSTLDRGLISIETSEGGFLIGGHSDSNISGDKSENPRGLFDNWLVKLDVNGNVEWDKTYGGNDNDLVRDIIQVSDGFIVGGYSHSGVSGDKTGELRGVVDYWIYKINSNGNMVWQKTIGGNQTDNLRTVRQKEDGNLLVTGYSNSNTSGDKTDDSNGGFDMWFLLLNPTGEILGQNTIGGSADEWAGYSIVLDDGYIFAVASNSNQSGDKTENSRGLEDYWLFETTNNLLGISSLEEQASILIYPNPIDKKFFLDFEKPFSHVSYEIVDMVGNRVQSGKFTNPKLEEIQFNAPSGTYFIRLFINQQKLIIKKLLVN